MLVLHHTQKPIKQVEIGIRLCGCKNNQGHVYIGHSRPDKFVFPWQYTLDIAYVLFIIEDCYVDDIANQRLYLLFSEGAFCFALVESAACGSFFCFFGFFYVDVVEAGNSFNNFSCHGFPCIAFVFQESRFRRGACRALRLCGWRGQAYIPLKKYEASPGLSYGQAMACSALFFPR